ncbi:hypothetical protein PSTG_03935 [Puccinia striiformis f. sp. tritici PST-78]|uniref:Uncharacterized protein n=1 Tax=Puccinia striiformis f. sp. tritici PST-78 TaxID=1165861 RepID=A0A0L0VVI3_9BASI|nr:hypothetical protein PSTG_03935 [Puccinia striiformis f. sp. tritici PST-78]
MNLPYDLSLLASFPSTNFVLGYNVGLPKMIVWMGENNSFFSGIYRTVHISIESCQFWIKLLLASFKRLLKLACEHVPLPAKLDRMVASELISGAAIRYKLGRCALSESQTPGPILSLGRWAIHLAAELPSSNRVAAPDVDSDATIQARFAGSVHANSQGASWIFAATFTYLYFFAEHCEKCEPSYCRKVLNPM